jgi:uncharacterized protein
MLVYVEQLKEAGLALEFEVPPARFPVLREMENRRECGFEEPIRTRLRAARIGELVEVEGDIRTAVRLTCGRCLTEFTMPLETAFALAYTQGLPEHIPGDEPEAREMAAEEAGLIVFRGESLDLTEGVQEQVVLALPLRPLCRETCRGLCPGCGADLNQESCRCPQRDGNSPFAALGRIRIRES